MVASLIANGMGYIYLSTAGNYFAFALAMVINGASNPLYRVGADAMIADLLVPDKRVDGYALMRMSNNLGVAIGPAVGGFLVAESYYLAFYMAAFGLCFFGVLLLFFARETMPVIEPTAIQNPEKKQGGYRPVLRDGAFLSFLGAYTLNGIAIMIVWVLLGVYALSLIHI